MILEDRKILIIGPTPPPYHGVSVAFETLLNSNIKEYFTVYHVDLADRRGIEHVQKPDFYDVILFIRQWLQMINIIFKEKPKIVYLAISQKTIGFIRDSLFILVSYLIKCEVVIHLHGGNFKNWYVKQVTLFRMYVKFVLKNVTIAIVLGKSLINNLSDIIDKDKILVVPNGIDFSREKNKNIIKKNNFILNNNRFRILFLSNLNKNKGALVLIESIPKVLKKIKNVKFIFAGQWTNSLDEKEAMNYIKRNRIEDYVTFTGRVKGKEKTWLLSTCDIFVFPGIQQEGQPLVVIEAMAAGLPIIYTNRGCLRETVKNFENGIEVRINDSEDISNKIIWLLENHKERKKMGEKSKKRYLGHYTSDKFNEKMLKIFKEIEQKNSWSPGKLI